MYMEVTTAAWLASDADVLAAGGDGWERLWMAAMI